MSVTRMTVTRMTVTRSLAAAAALAAAALLVAAPPAAATTAPPDEGTLASSAPAAVPDAWRLVDGSAIHLINGTSTPLRLSSGPATTGSPTVVPPGAAADTAGYNAVTGPIWYMRDSTGAPFPRVVLKDDLDAAMYLGSGYWIGAHNTFGDAAKFVVARFDQANPATGDEAAKFGVAMQLFGPDRTITFGKISVKVEYVGSRNGHITWNATVTRFSP